MESCFILIDYANFNWSKIDFSQLLNLAIGSLKHNDIFAASINIRIYGGWFYNDVVTQQRIDAMITIANWPNIIRVFDKIYRIKYTFSDTLYGFNKNEFAQIKKNFIERKEKLHNIKFQKTENISNLCTKTNCSIDRVNRWLKSDKACINTDCPRKFSDFFVRFEQKQVDTHILVDFLHIIHMAEENFVFIMSDDIDFLPGIQYAIVNKKNSCIGLLCTEKINPYMHDILTRSNIILLQIQED
jgi:uncharacterized LabA/DUF88 family protein